MAQRKALWRYQSDTLHHQSFGLSEAVHSYTHVDITIDGDSPDHIMWMYDEAVKRADEYKIQGVTYRLTQGTISPLLTCKCYLYSVHVFQV